MCLPHAKKSSVGLKKDDLATDVSEKVHQTETLQVLDEVTSRPTILVVTIIGRLATLQAEDDTAYDDTRISTLVRLFYAIASPDAIYQFRDAFCAFRQGRFQIAEAKDDILRTIRALDRLEVNNHIISTMRRLYLVSLSAKRLELQKSLLDWPNAQVVLETDNIGFGRKDSLVLDHIMAEAYPQLKRTRTCQTQGKDEYGKKRRTLSNRLLNGQKWSRLSEAFAPGILAMIPTQCEYNVSSRE